MYSVCVCMMCVYVCGVEYVYGVCMWYMFMISAYMVCVVCLYGVCIYGVCGVCIYAVYLCVGMMHAHIGDR